MTNDLCLLRAFASSLLISAFYYLLFPAALRPPSSVFWFFPVLTIGADRAQLRHD
jgi:hypothetical protein